MNVLEQCLEIKTNGVVAAVQFYAVGRQFGHEIRIERDGSSVCIRTDDQPSGSWPPSPPIQDVHFEERDDCRFLFGVGMAGKTHYSVSIACDGKSCLKFEFAALVKNQPSFVGTTYRIVEANPNEIPRDLLLPLEDSAMNLGDKDQSNQTLLIEPAARNFSPLPYTVQWGFEIRE